MNKARNSRYCFEPPTTCEIVSCGFLFFTPGVNMHVGFEVEQFRQKYGFTVVCIRTTLDMTDAEYQRFIQGKYKPAAYQLIGFLTGFRCPLDSIVGQKFTEGMPTPPYKQL